MSIEKIKKRIIGRGYIGYEETLLSSLESDRIEIKTLKQIIEFRDSSLEKAQVYIEQLRGTLGYSVPDHIRENPEIKNGIADALHQQLEKEEQAHTMSVYDLNMKIAEVGIALEKEKESVLQLREAWRIQDELWKEEKKRADKVQDELNYVDMILERRDALDSIPDRIGKILYAIESAKKAEERVKELEAKLASIKNDPSIGKLEIEGDFDDNDWP